MVGKSTGRLAAVDTSDKAHNVQGSLYKHDPTSFVLLGISLLRTPCCAVLRQVPIEVMNSMTRVPAAYLKQLAEEREIFNKLPAAVKQQVRNALPSIL